MKLIIDIPEDTYIKMKILSDCGLGSDAIKYILNNKSLDDILQQVKQDIIDESYCKPGFDYLPLDCRPKIIDIEDVFRIIDNRLIKE